MTFKKVVLAALMVASANTGVWSEAPHWVKVSASNKKACVDYARRGETLYCTTQPTGITPASSLNAIRAEKMRIVFDSRTWIAGWGQKTEEGQTVEYVPSGQSVEQWTELVTSQFLPRVQGTPTRFANLQHGQLLKGGFHPIWVVHKEAPTETIVEFRIAQPSAQAQDELQRIIARPEGFYVLHYAVKKPDMGEAARKKWLSLLQRAMPLSK